MIRPHVLNKDTRASYFLLYIFSTLIFPLMHIRKSERVWCSRNQCSRPYSVFIKIYFYRQLKKYFWILKQNGNHTHIYIISYYYHHHSLLPHLENLHTIHFALVYFVLSLLVHALT